MQFLVFRIFPKIENASTTRVLGFAQFRHNLNFAELRKEKEPKRKV